MGNLAKTNQEWKKKLSAEKYHIMREKGTEQPFSGQYTDFDERGVYVCGSCGNELFESDNKFKSECGWPSFDDILSSDAVNIVTDSSFNMKRNEVVCSNCDGHLGHVFPDGPKETTGLRYCINSVSLDFKPKNN
jgi:peptide-methionine (R)-S-oxide reductase